jgi:hypothetical protein
MAAFPTPTFKFPQLNHDKSCAGEFFLAINPTCRADDCNVPKGHPSDIQHEIKQEILGSSGRQNPKL